MTLEQIVCAGRWWSKGPALEAGHPVSPGCYMMSRMSGSSVLAMRLGGPEGLSEEVHLSASLGPGLGSASLQMWEPLPAVLWETLSVSEMCPAFLSFHYLCVQGQQIDRH